MARTTVVSVRKQKNRETCVYVGRAMPLQGLEGSPFGNPFRVGEDGDLQTVLFKYLLHVLSRPDLLALIPTLRGKALGCWCCEDLRNDFFPRDPATYVCHAQILADLADGPLGNPREAERS